MQTFPVLASRTFMDLSEIDAFDTEYRGTSIHVATQLSYIDEVDRQGHRERVTEVFRTYFPVSFPTPKNILATALYALAFESEADGETKTLRALRASFARSKDLFEEYQEAAQELSEAFCRMDAPRRTLTWEAVATPHAAKVFLHLLGAVGILALDITDHLTAPCTPTSSSPSSSTVRSRSLVLPTTNGTSRSSPRKSTRTGSSPSAKGTTGKTPGASSLKSLTNASPRTRRKSGQISSTNSSTSSSGRSRTRRSPTTSSPTTNGG